MSDVEPFYPPLPSRGTRKISARADRGRGRGHLVANGTRISVDSGLEYKAAFVLLAHPDVVDVREQPPAVAYVDEDGRARSYTFDFLVTRRNGRRSAIEVKASRYAEAARRKVEAVARQAPRGFAADYHVLTEAHLGRDAVHDARLIHDMRRLADPTHDALVDGLIAAFAGTTTVSCLVDATGLGPPGFAAVVRAVGRGVLLKADARRLSYDSVVRRAAGAATPAAFR